MLPYRKLQETVGGRLIPAAKVCGEQATNSDRKEEAAESLELASVAS